MQNDYFDASKTNPAIQNCVDCYVVSSFLLSLLIIVLLDKSKTNENKLYFKEHQSQNLSVTKKYPLGSSYDAWLMYKK